jgi:hypothetical protein
VSGADAKTRTPDAETQQQQYWYGDQERDSASVMDLAGVARRHDS